MSRPDPLSETAADWLARAKGKLALASVSLPPGGYLEDLCFCAQQAAELAIKAVYLQQGWTFAYIHDLGRLLDELEQQGMQIPPEVQEADQLSLYAVQTRYPGTYTPITRAEYADALSTAMAVVAWAERLIS